MSRRPYMLYIMAMALLVTALSFPVQTMVIYGFSITDFSAIFHKISLLNWLVTVSCLMAIPFVINGSRSMVVVVPLAAIVVAWNNYVVGSYGADFSASTTTWATLMFVVSQAIIFHPKVTYILKNPNQRWWAQAQRHKKQLPVTMNVIRGVAYEARTFDISESGMFIPFDTGMIDMDFCQPGDVVDLKLPLDSLHSVRCQARVVRKARGEGHYPSGVGVQFVDLNATERQHLKRYLDAH